MSLFIYHSSHGTILLLVYVDDLILTGSNPRLLQLITSQLQFVFAIKDLGPLHYLGIQVHGDGLILTQAKYVEDLLTELQFHHLKSSPSPMVSGECLSLDGDPTANPQLFRSTLDSLQYLLRTHPNIAFTVNKLSQFNQHPTNIHWQALKCVLRYLKGTIHLDLHIT